MTRDLIALVLLVVAFATLVTVHVTLAVGVATHGPRWRGFVAFLVPPLALWWGWRACLRVRGVLWVVAGVVYSVSLGFSLGG